MKILKPFIFISFIFLSAFSFATTGKKVKWNTTVTIFQDGIGQLVKNDSTISISRAPFSVRFYNKTYDFSNKKEFMVKLAVFLEKAELTKISEGMLNSETRCFHGGTCLVSPNNFYDYLYFSDHVSHCLYYENETNRRVNWISGSADWMYLDFPVPALRVKEEILTMQKFTKKEFYVAMLNDLNLDEKIDAGELLRFTLRFE